MAGRAEPQGREYERPGLLGRLRQGFLPLPDKEDPETKLVGEDEVERALDEAPDPVATAALLREQAERVQSSGDERGRAAEARATTVLGTVPIAASVVIAGAGLTLGENNVPRNWSVLIMAIVALLLLLLLICGFTASRAVLKVRIRVTNEPRIRQALEWAGNPDTQAVRVKRVMDLVRRADETLYVAEYKRAQLKVAYYWYRAALTCFGLLGIVLLVYTLARNDPTVSFGDALIAAIAALIGATLATARANYRPKTQTADNAVTFDRVEIPVAGATLVGDRWKGDGATVVLLHAGVCDRRCWREVGERLSAGGRDVVAYDRRGFGEVPPAGGRFRHVDDLLGVLDAVSPNAPAWLVGSSIGGEVALDAALEAPERIAGLVLLAPAVGGDPEPDEEAHNAATGGLADAIDAAWTAGDLNTCNRLEVRLWLDGPAGPEGRVSGPGRELALDMNRIVLANGESDADGASGLDAASRLHEITVPAIVACGELDVPVKVRRSAELADALPNATHRTLSGRAHLPYLEAPDDVAALILSEGI